MSFLRHILTGVLPAQAHKHRDSLKEGLFGKQSELRKYKTLTHGQRKLLDFVTQRANKLAGLPGYKHQPLYQAGQSYLQNLLSQTPEQRYAGLEAPYMRQFQEQIMPQLAEQYAGAGALGSSGFQNAAAGAGADLMERLAALNIGQQNIFRQQQLGALPIAESYAQLPLQRAMMQRNLQLQRGQMALGTPAFRYVEQPGSEGLLGHAARGIGAGGGFGIGSAAGGILGAPFGPLGSMAGSAIGQGIQNLFS